uniref:Uncharacterized protein n=1 Tax=Glossina pallidipes TaxID=7398 RepID=A0A1A9Z278_GLOPL
MSETGQNSTAAVIEVELSSTAMPRKLHWEICLMRDAVIMSLVENVKNNQCCHSVMGEKKRQKITAKIQLKTVLSAKPPISSNAFLYCKIDKENSRGDKIRIRHKLSLPMNITLIGKTRTSLETNERNVHMILCYFAEGLVLMYDDK